MGTFPRSIGTIGLAAVWLTGCLHSRYPDFDELSRSAGPTRFVEDERDRSSEDDAALEKQADLPGILRLAVAHNPEVLEAKARVEERLARVPASARLPDLELKLEQWGAPLARPYALDEADTLMVGVRQSFPAYGSRDAEEQGLVEEAKVALYEMRARQLEVVRQVKRAYLEYYLAGSEYRIHLEHLELTKKVSELTRDLFRVGRVSEQDVLRLQLAVSELHRDLASIQQRQRSAAAMLNSLMGRSPEAALGPAPDLAVREIHIDRDRVEAMALERRPELLAARHAVQSRQAGVVRAERSARWPSFMVGVDYMYMSGFDAPHRYGAMVSINLPWLNGKYQDDIEVTRRSKSVEARALDTATSAVRYEIRDAWARYQAALELYRLTSADVLPAAQRSFEAARAAFGVGRGDALALLDASRSLLEVRLDEQRALVALATAMADLEHAAGTELTDATSPRGTSP